MNEIMDLSQLPQHIFGMHDEGAEQFFTDAGKRAWIVFSVVATDGPRDFSALSNAGHGVIVRLNNGYGSAGTLPFSSQYDAFAAACAQYAANSQGAHIWIIGNETNLQGERPGNGSPEEEPITPERYGECFAKCRATIKNVPGHADDWVMPAPPGPWNNQTAYPANPAGDWVTYFGDLLNECLKRRALPDALALHTYSNHSAPQDAALVESDERAPAPFQARHWQFRAYRDFLGVVPAALRGRPVLITESQHLPWENRDHTWIQRAYAEINAWNANAANQSIQALCLFRWQRNQDDPDGWSISNKNKLVNDLRAALQNDFRARWIQTAAPAQPVIVAPPAVTTPTSEHLPLAKTRWFVEETIRKLEAQDGNAARGILTQTVIPWFYATAPKHSTSLSDAQAQTAARWHCEEATRQIEAQALNDAANTLRQNVLTWLASPGPGALGILSVEYPPKAQAPKRQAAAKKARVKKPQAPAASVKASPKSKRATGKKKTATKTKGK
ncbi:MAG: hypothetical protein B6D41_14885 [Chloroflexi bacterium UTCFX4]|nr:MAG: hypothetical protein B6D41_14885 [Chloroflexi bacterium UTCFX4]